MKLFPTKLYFSQENIEFILGDFKELLKWKSFLVLDKFCLVGPGLMSNREILENNKGLNTYHQIFL